MAAMAMQSSSVLSSSSAFSHLAGRHGAAAPSHIRLSTPSLGIMRRGVVRMEAVQPSSPSKPSGLGGTEIPLGDMISSAPIEQKNVPKSDRIAYICQDCGYVYDLDKPFEEQPDETYNCPVCKAPKTRFAVQNTSVGEAQSISKEEYGS